MGKTNSHRRRKGKTKKKEASKNKNSFFIPFFHISHTSAIIKL